MPRSLRLHVPGAFYHVTLRGNHRQDIFFARRDRLLFEELTAEVLERFCARLHAYCWMTNHVHMLLQVGDTPLGRLMLRIAGRYARSVQRHLGTTGHLFEKRYYPVLVDADEHLLGLLRYIHLNPVRSQLVKHPSAYPWSSHHAYLGRVTQPWLTTDFALRMFHLERKGAIDAYAHFVDQGLASDCPSPLLECNSSDKRILGSDDFAGKLLGAAWKSRSRTTLSELVEVACREFSVTEEELRSPSCERRLTKGRAWVAHQAVVQRIASLSTVARHFNRSEAALRQGIKYHFNYP
jgi:REP element-mobilizing transposase RayT